MITKEKLSKFRNELKDFTNRIFVSENGLISDGNGLWQHSGNISEYIWNRYKPSKNSTNLVIYINASTLNDEGIYISIGLNENYLSDFESENKDKIYDFIVESCKEIECEGFERVDFGWGDRVFKIKDLNQYDSLNYKCLLDKLKIIYEKTIIKLYKNLDGDKMPQSSNQNQPLNQILYGPPGTGKTYHTINKAIEIIENRVVEETEDRIA